MRVMSPISSILGMVVTGPPTYRQDFFYFGERFLRVGLGGGEGSVPLQKAATVIKTNTAEIAMRDFIFSLLFFFFPDGAKSLSVNL